MANWKTRNVFVCKWKWTFVAFPKFSLMALKTLCVWIPGENSRNYTSQCDSSFASPPLNVCKVGTSQFPFMKPIYFWPPPGGELQYSKATNSLPSYCSNYRKFSYWYREFYVDWLYMLSVMRQLLMWTDAIWLKPNWTEQQKTLS